ncbi:hypothetical protein ACLB2K_076267 [Fragaria x ananassa]
MAFTAEFGSGSAVTLLLLNKVNVSTRMFWKYPLTWAILLWCPWPEHEAAAETANIDKNNNRRDNLSFGKAQLLAVPTKYIIARFSVSHLPLLLSLLISQAATMVRVSVLNDALKGMYNAEKRGKRQVMIRPSSKVIIKFLTVMQKHGYIGEFEYVDDHRSGKIVVELNGRLNKCGVISPRFDVGVKEIEGWTARLLPSRQLFCSMNILHKWYHRLAGYESTTFGYIVLTTSAGIMDHEEARRKNVGGKVLGFFY